MRLLFVDPPPGIPEDLSWVLKKHVDAPVTLQCAASAFEADEFLGEENWDVLILPGTKAALSQLAGAWELCRPKPPVGIVAWGVDSESYLLAVECGADECVWIGRDDPEAWLVRIHSAIQRCWERRLLELPGRAARLFSYEQSIEGVAARLSQLASESFRADAWVLWNPGKEGRIVRSAPVLSGARPPRSTLQWSDREAQHERCEYDDVEPLAHRYGFEAALLGDLGEKGAGYWSAYVLRDGSGEVTGLLILRRGESLSARVADSVEDLVQQASATTSALRLREKAEERRNAAEATVRVRDEALGFVAHDLRSPLSAISMSASLLARSPLEPEQCKPLYAGMMEAAARMSRLVADLLEISRIGAGQLSLLRTPVRPQRLLRAIVQEMGVQARDRGVRLRIRCRADVPELYADADRLKQVLVNLLGNALRYTSAGGSIWITTERMRGGVCFRVRDTGSGIAPEHLPYLFDRFWQPAQRRRGSAGLGLSICKAITEAHGGRIKVRSSIGKGTVFSIWLPFGQPPQRGLRPDRRTGRVLAGVAREQRHE